MANKESLFQILSRQPWWITLLVAFGLFWIAYAIFPPVAPFVALPFLVLGLYFTGLVGELWPVVVGGLYGVALAADESLAHSGRILIAISGDVDVAAEPGYVRVALRAGRAVESCSTTARSARAPARSPRCSRGPRCGKAAIMARAPPPCANSA